MATSELPMNQVQKKVVSVKPYNPVVNAFVPNNKPKSIYD